MAAKGLKWICVHKHTDTQTHAWTQYTHVSTQYFVFFSVAYFSVCGAVIIAQHTVLSFNQFCVACTIIKRYFKTVTMYAFTQAHPHNAHGYLQVELASACTE